MKSHVKNIITFALLIVAMLFIADTFIAAVPTVPLVTNKTGLESTRTSASLFNRPLTVTAFANANVTVGNDSTKTVTFTSRLKVRQVNDSGMTNVPGTEGEIVYNLDDNIFYGCTVTSTTNATWAALNQ